MIPEGKDAIKNSASEDPEEYSTVLDAPMCNGGLVLHRNPFLSGYLKFFSFLFILMVLLGKLTVQQGKYEEEARNLERNGGGRDTYIWAGRPVHLARMEASVTPQL